MLCSFSFKQLLLSMCLPVGTKNYRGKRLHICNQIKTDYMMDLCNVKIHYSKQNPRRRCTALSRGLHGSSPAEEALPQEFEPNQSEQIRSVLFPL